MKKAGKTKNQSPASLDEDFYRSLFENSVAGIGRTALEDGRILLANSRLAQIFGYRDRDQFIREFSFGEHYAEGLNREEILEYCRQNPDKPHKASFTGRDGSLVHIESETRVDIDEGVVDFVVIDVTERYAAQAELEKSIEEKSQAEDLVRTMIENSPVSLSLKDRDGKYLYVSRAYANYLGLGVDDMLGKTPIDLLGPEVGQKVLDADQSVLSTGESLLGEDSFAVEVGDSILQVSKFPIPDADGKIHRTASVGVDITELERTRQALHERTELLEEAERLAQLGHWKWNDAGDEMIYCSREAASIFKMTQQELAENFGTLEKELELILDEDREKFTSDVTQLMERLKSETDKPFQIELQYRVKLADGSIRHLRETNGTELDEWGNVVRSIGTVQDITELARTRESLQKRTELLEQAEHNARLGHWKWDENIHELTFCSRQAANIFGVTVDEMHQNFGTHEKVLDLVHPDDRELVDREVWKFVHQTEAIPDQPYQTTFEYRLQHPDNSLRYIRETLGTEIDAHGNCVRSIGTLLDITELAEARNELERHRDQLELLVEQRTRELRESEEVFRSFYEVIPDNSLITTLEDGIVVSVNQGYTENTGHRYEDVVGKSVQDLGLWHDYADRDRLVSALKRDGKVSNLEAEFCNEDGSVWPGIMAACIIQYQGKPHILSTTMDVSAIRQAQEAAIQANQAKSQFLSSMSHELRTPLHAIHGFAQILEQDDELKLTARHQRAFEIIRKSSQHLMQLINQILELPRIEAGDIDLELQATDVLPLIQECIEMVEGATSSKSIQMNNEVSDQNLPPVHVDPVRTRQILLNLLSNAIKYNSDGGIVEIRYKLNADGHIRLSIIDSGAGLAEGEQARLFEPFERLDKAESNIEGAGIGLAISKQLIEAMGGAIGFESAPGQGSHFWIDLPVSTGTVTRTDVDETAASNEARSIASSNGKRHILYIEDNEVNITLMENILEELDNTELTSVFDAESGIELARTNPPDLILMDVSLPGMDGVEAAGVLKSNPETNAIPIIGISAAAMKSDIERAQDAGFYAYKTKPFNIGEFLQTIERAMSDQ